MLHSSLSDPSITYSATKQPSGLFCPDEHLRLYPLIYNSCNKTKKYGLNDRTDQSSGKNITKQRRDTQLIRCRVKTLVFRMLTEMVEHGCKIEENVKAIKSEMKENAQESNSEGKETEAQINGLEEKEEINIQPEQNEESRIQKNEERPRTLWDNFKCSNIQIIGFLEGEEEQHEIEHLLKK